MDVSRSKDPEPREEAKASREGSEPQRSRKPYEKPAFRCERIFETMALACGKISQTQGHCRFNRKSS
jgi:hypothetical protein